ncbi:telomere-protecting terminal protein Tpg [Streptomyces malaysiensis]|uniref:telomere-protecting terminal protein Tpg n=1 Tax=Streptomyces malaysiensis TaxID=92644 RepID=UPI002B2DD0E4|nr:hypothetical protein R8789_08965 [Streptomyces malaysiensis]
MECKFGLVVIEVRSLNFGGLSGRLFLNGKPGSAFENTVNRLRAIWPVGSRSGQALRQALDREVRKAWQPRVRAAAAPPASPSRPARFDYTAPVSTTDDPRMRRLAAHLPPAYAAHLFDAQQHGATDPQLRAIVTEGLHEIYFKDNTARAQGLEAAPIDIDCFDASY